MSGTEVTEDVKTLRELNDTFIEAFRKGSWDMLSPILSPGFTYTDGNTGAVTDIETYAASLQANPVPDLVFDEVVVHVDGDAAIVSARTSVTPGKYSRYVDSYARRDGQWVCHHASVWRLQPATG
ncbi:MAG TPA: nuclear transport factor 2 family protein [Pseudonocardiaceae bacterium]